MFGSSPSLSLWLTLWSGFWLASFSAEDWWAYGSAFVVLIGVIGESIAELKEWEDPRDKRKERLAKASALVLILGLAGDLVSIHLAQKARNVLTKEAGDAKTSAERARVAAGAATTSAREAKSKAGDAVRTANEAAVTSGKANRVSRDALALGSRARQEADSVEADIKSAKQRLIELGARRILLTSDDVRSRLVAELKPFAEQKFAVVSCGTEYSAAQIEESSLAIVLESILTSARWKPVPHDVFSEGCAGVGILVVVSPAASDATANAGAALTSALGSVPPSNVVLARLKPLEFQPDTVLVQVFAHPP